MQTGEHAERAHSMFSASGSERWLNCAASVHLEEKSPPQADTFWSKEGTLAHEVLECLLLRLPLPNHFDVTKEMIAECDKVATKIRALHRAFGGILLVEKKVFAMFIDPEMFGTCDAILITDEGVLNIIDFKYGRGHVVNPEKNTQLIQYALSVAEAYDWGRLGRKFDRVKMWIMQPRAGAKWFKSWEIPVTELEHKWLSVWQSGVKRVRSGKNLKPHPGNWCHWCKAKAICPAKAEMRVARTAELF